MISEWTLLIVLLVPIAGMAVGSVAIALWARLSKFGRAFYSPLSTAKTRHLHGVLHANR
ncbi:hypothetical protein [Alteromonas oceanisediminis]|uniref:hypothetical protein n=1 Tax=Alteromonas oceanisediminis TaxID=2836180 RepID=UPI001BDA0E2D|nr:hypothetical protein [Alteromonas oceanisediminis]MBT0586128.1 hypothetical protein [Alteromonas oceanisediminis]